MKKVLSMLLSAEVLLPTLALPASAAGSENVAIRLEKARGGAKAIVSMTFDDGDYESAVFLKELCKSYELSASLMMIVERLSYEYAASHENARTYMEWYDIFEGGYLYPENHSYTHMVLPSDAWAEKNGKHTLNNNTDENYNRELLYSADCLRDWFDAETLVFAPSNNTLSDGALDVIRANYYAVRQGSRGVQSLDPTVGSTDKGSWYNLYMRGIDDTSAEGIKGYIDQCVDQNGWFLSMTHKVNTDEKQQRFAEVFDYIKTLVDAGDVWCADFATATKYVRERQNTTAEAYRMGSRIYMTLTLAEMTAEELPLPKDVFCEPLTARLTVPNEWKSVSYTMGDETVTAPTFTQGGYTYVYVDAIPDGEQVIITAAETVDAPTDTEEPEEEERGFIAFIKSIWNKILTFFRKIFGIEEE